MAIFTENDGREFIICGIFIVEQAKLLVAFIVVYFYRTPTIRMQET